MSHKTFFLFFIALLLFFSDVIPQSNFNIQLYRDYLQSNQNLQPGALMQMHPAGEFIADIGLQYMDARYFDSINANYNLTTYEKELISQHGFMVTERLKRISFGEAFLEIFHKDLPVYISTDAILHAFHVSYSRIMMDVENGILIPRLITFLSTLHSKQNLLAARYASNPEMETMLKDVDVYVTVPLKLLGQNVIPYYQSNQTTINQIMTLINNELPENFALFSENCKLIDWSQFKPRGHYANHHIFYPKLEEYFRAMMWLGRTELYLGSPEAVFPPPGCDPQTFTDIQRQIIDAFLLSELVEISNAYSTYEEMEDILTFFVGEQDNVNLDHLSYLSNALSLSNASGLLDSLKVVEFHDTLAQQSFAAQLILSQILFSNPMSPDSIKPASAFLLFGQRFVIDSYVTASVVFDRIMYQGNKICRLFPSTQDALFSLGNNASAQLLQEELEQYKYSSNLAALRYLIDSYDDSFWNSSLYNIWLSSIKKLNPSNERENLPLFMQTAAFWQKQMNTQLASWTELRHDNLLYAKQSYTGGTICSYPYSYVEPFPEFYQSLKTFSTIALDKFQTLNFPDPTYKYRLIHYFNHLYGVSDTLQTISVKEIEGIDLSVEEKIFLTKLIYQTGNMSGPRYDGWYPHLFYWDEEHDDKGLMQSDHLVADIHTTPTDCSGVMGGWISHVGTGPVNLGLFVTDDPDGVLTAYIGPLISYFEYRTNNFLRLTDDEWNQTYLQSALRPAWVNLYLADTLGNSRGTGPSLVTSIMIDEESTVIPQSEVLIANYPNPFNASTLIAFTIPYDLTNNFVELNVYDVRGRLVKTLVNEVLSAGNYIVRWEGDNSSGQHVASGVYFYKIQAGNINKSEKMILLR